jgi:hypothetical protein
MSDMQLDSDQPCLASRSLVDMGQYAIYASPNGLVAAGGGEATVITRGMISKEQWLALDPASIHGYRHEGRYLAFYAGGCFSFTPGEGFEFYDISAAAGYYDISRDNLYLIQGNSITVWGEGDLLEMRWRSKIHEQTLGTPFSCAKVNAKAYPVTMSIFVDGVELYTHEALSRALFRIPVTGNDSREWEIEVRGTNEVSSVQLASAPAELL